MMLNPIFSFKDKTDGIRRVRFSSDGLKIASCSLDGAFINIWSLRNGQLLKEIYVNNFGSINDIAFSPNSDILAAGCEDKSVRLFDTDNGQMVGSLLGHKGEVTCVAFSNDGEKIVSGSKDNTIRLWNSKNHNAICEIQKSYNVTCVNFFPNAPFPQTIISADSEGHLELWDAQNGKPLGRLGNIDFLPIIEFAISRDEKLLAITSTDEIHLWNIKENRDLGRVINNFPMVYSLAFDPSEPILAFGNDDGSIKFLDLRRMEVTQTLKVHNEGVLSIAYSNNGQFLASGSKDQTINVWTRGETALDGDENINRSINSMQKWEYLTLIAGFQHGTDLGIVKIQNGQEIPNWRDRRWSVDSALQELGEKGWELVTVLWRKTSETGYQDPVYYFKRQK